MPSMGGWEWAIMAAVVLLVVIAIPVLLIVLIVKARKPKPRTVDEQLNEILFWKQTAKIDSIEYDKLRKKILGIT